MCCSALQCFAVCCSVLHLASLLSLSCISRILFLRLLSLSLTHTPENRPYVEACCIYAAVRHICVAMCCSVLHLSNFYLSPSVSRSRTHTPAQNRHYVEVCCICAAVCCICVAMCCSVLHLSHPCLSPSVSVFLTHTCAPGTML